MSTTASTARFDVAVRPAPQPTGVVVGNDGRRHSRRLVEIAGDEAERRGLPLTILVVVKYTPDPELSVEAQLRDERDAASQARIRLADSLAEARKRHPENRTDGLLVIEPEQGELTQMLSGCALVVVGSRSDWGSPVFALGTTSRQLLRAVRCPVLVIPVDDGHRHDHSERRIVAGIDHGPLGPEIIRAAAVAAGPSGHVELVHSYRIRPDESPESAHARAETTCELQLELAGPLPGVEITQRLSMDPPSQALLQRSSDASLVVIGSRGTMALAGLTLESVSHEVLHSARRPVLIVTKSALRR